MVLADTLRALIAEHESAYIAARRRIHAFAEIGGKEVKTSAFVQEELTRLGIAVTRIGNTGLMGILDTGNPGPVIALRADLDALPLSAHPENLRQPRTCTSENPGGFHACGHDAHTAMLLGAARVLSAVRGNLAGRILFCFEEGEEVGLGFRDMIQALRRQRPDKVLALHVLPGLAAGKIDISSGARMAGGRKVLLRVQGKGGHGSRPDLANNPVYAAAAIVSALPGVLQNSMNPEKPVTVGITSVQGGNSENVFPDYADIKGTIRFFDADEGEKAAQAVRRVAESTAAMLGCSVAFDPAMERRGLPVINHPAAVERAQSALAKLGFFDAIAHCPPLYASETFAYYLDEFPGALLFLGIANDTLGSGAPLHSDRFDIDESALSLGVAALAAFAAADDVQTITNEEGVGNV